jgi:hypothetical protein
LQLLGFFPRCEGKSRLRAEKGWTERREQPHKLGLAVAALRIRISGFCGVNEGADEPSAGATGEGEPRADERDANPSLSATLKWLQESPVK